MTLIALSESEKTKFGKEEFAIQSFPQKVFPSVWAVESEVNNGGFSQYFLNSSTETTPFIVQALDAIGAPRTADICRPAISCAYPTGLPPTVEELSSLATELSDETLARLEALDTEFLAYSHDLTRCCSPTSLPMKTSLGLFQNRTKGHKMGISEPMSDPEPFRPAELGKMPKVPRTKGS